RGGRHHPPARRRGRPGGAARPAAAHPRSGRVPDLRNACRSQDTQLTIKPEETKMTTTANRIITSENMIRATSPFAIIAGLIYARIQPIHPPDFLASVTTVTWSVFMSLKLAMSLFFIVAITGLYVRQIGRSGWIAFAGFVLFGLAWWLETGFIFVELFILPPLAAVAPQFIDSFLGIV